MIKTQITNELEKRNLLEKYLRMCVDDVKAEIEKKKNEGTRCKIIGIF